MTIDMDPRTAPLGEMELDPAPTPLVTGRMVSLRFLTGALRRRRRLWLGLALLGLIIGVGYHVAVPPQYSASSTVYLAYAPGSDAAVESANDLAMVKTAAVGEAAVKALGEKGLTSTKLLGKAPAVIVSDNILTLTTSGSTAHEAVRRVNALTTAYLAFRSQQYSAQNQAVTNAANAQINKFEAQVNQLTAQINSLDPSTDGNQITNLIDQRSTISNQITNLQQTVQQDNLATLSVTNGSQVLTSGTAGHLSKAKVFLLDGMSGLIAGLALGMLYVILAAILSDRLRRREDIAAVLGVPIELSVGRVKRRSIFSGAHLPSSLRRLSHFLHLGWLFGQSVSDLVEEPSTDVLAVAQLLRDRLESGGPRPTELVVALDDTVGPAIAVSTLVADLSRLGKKVVLIDATAERVLAKTYGDVRANQQRIEIAGSPEVTLLTPALPGGPDEAGRHKPTRTGLGQADAVVVLATVDAASGAWHLATWASQAVVTVSAGGSSAERINAVAELLEAANITVDSAVLLGADANDDSVGIPEPGAAVFGRRLGLVPIAEPALT